jgi:hypothetical protein
MSGDTLQRGVVVQIERDDTSVGPPSGEEAGSRAEL